MATPPSKKVEQIPQTSNNVADYEKRAAWMRAKKAHEEDPRRFPLPPRPDCFDDTLYNQKYNRSPFTPVPQPASHQPSPPPALPGAAEPEKRASVPCANTAHEQQPTNPPPSPPPIPSPTPPTATVAVTVAGTAATVTPPPNTVDTKFATPHAPQLVAPAVNSTAPEPLAASRLTATATDTGGAVPPEVATSPSGGEQGVTIASLQFTLPGTPSGRAGKKGAWKNTPYKPRKKMQPEELRTHCVSVRFSAAELARLTTDMQAQHKKELGAVLRDAYLHGPRPVVPAVNLDKWRELARAVSNLNQIAILLNSEVIPEDCRPFLDKLARQIHLFRAELLGQKEDK